MNTKQLNDISIITEIHTIRKQLAKQYNNDLTAYSHAAENHCRALGFLIAENLRTNHSILETENN